MSINVEAFKLISEELSKANTQLVAVSKTKPVSSIQELYNLGQRDFGENYVQELVDKYELLPKDIRWHFIGHLQTNKVKYIAPFVHLVHGVDSYKLLKEINKQAEKNNRIIHCLLQIYIAQEETKFGLDETELKELFKEHEENKLNHICIDGFMGMASFSDNETLLKSEFAVLKQLYNKFSQTNNFSTLSMGMSSDYKIAITEGSNMVRIGSLLFGSRS